MSDKVRNGLTIIILVWANLVSAYTVRLVWWAVAWFEVDMWLFYPTLILAPVLLLLIIPSFFKRYFKVIAVINAITIVLGFSYGLHFVGFDEMFRTYRNLSISHIITLILLTAVWLRSKKTGQSATL